MKERERKRKREKKETEHKATMSYDIVSALTFCPVLAPVLNTICYVKFIPEWNKDYD